ncbi:MAG: dihydrodipicolinate synthase family protein [bacterium]|nr:dihydrodipicolinate synthase family protein [bacterium]
MSQDPFRGVFTIPSTPFAEDGTIDWSDLKRVVNFCVDCDAHGIVWPVNASGFPVLTDEERLKGMRVVTEETNGRIPVLLGVQGVSDQHAALFSQRATEVQADGVIAMAPYVQELEDDAAVIRYYQAIDAAVDVPIFIQNHARGSIFSIDLMVRLLNEIEHIEYIKEETFPVTHKITGLIERGGHKLKGVFGGAGGRYLLQEHPRGVAGQMPGCHVTDVVVRLWNALESGDRQEAKKIFGILSPLFALETLKGTYYPEVLRRRQVIKSSRSRLSVTYPTQDAYDHEALDDALRDLEPLFTWTEKPVIYGTPEWIQEGSERRKQKQTDQVDTFDRAG